MSPVRVTGIVLAGGRSTRFGEDKLVAQVSGALLGQLRVATLAPEEWRVFDPAGESLRDVDTREDLAPPQ